MINKWLTVIIIILAAIAFMKQPTDKPITAQEKKETYETIDKIKTYVDGITTNPSSLTGKNYPVISQNDAIEKDAIEKKETSSSYTIESGKQALQDKIINFTYSILHTKPGQELIEKLLYNPDVNKENKDTKKATPYHNNSTIDINIGEGKEVECGDIVQINYTTRLVNGQIIEDTSSNKKPTIIQLGNQKVIRGLEHALIGMKVGGFRRVLVSPKFAYTNSKLSRNLVAGNEFISIDVELLALKQPPTNDQDKIRVFQKKSNEIDPSRQALNLCSTEVYFTYKISTANEKVLATSKTPVKFVMGSRDVPQALTKVFSGLMRPAEYTIIMPSNLLNTKLSFLPSNVKLPKNETLILDIETKR